MKDRIIMDLSDPEIDEKLVLVRPVCLCGNCPDEIHYKDEFCEGVTEYLTDLELDQKGAAIYAAVQRIKELEKSQADAIEKAFYACRTLPQGTVSERAILEYTEKMRGGE